MKYSNYIGIAAAVALIITCFFPWSYIPAIHSTLTGLHTPHTNYGRPGLMNIVFSLAAIVCFLLPVVGAKRANLFFCALNLAWTIRNFLLLSACELGECPEKKPALYVLVFLGLIMMVMSLFPRVELKK
jgi:hypothetical protein